MSNNGNSALVDVREGGSDRRANMSRLTRDIRSLETAGRPSGSWVSSGSRLMDGCLPGGGYALGSMVELVEGELGRGERVRRELALGERRGVEWNVVGRALPARGLGLMGLGLRLAREWMTDGKYLVVVDREQRLYAPGVAALGVACERLIVLRPRSEADAIWGMDQALRSPAVGAVIATVRSLDDRVARRLQLATEQGAGLGILLRDPISARLHPSWADIQWRVHAVEHGLDWETRWLELELTRASGGAVGRRLRLGLSSKGGWVDESSAIGVQHEQAGAKYLAAQLAQPARRRRELAG
jgi:hypothetical protein